MTKFCKIIEAEYLQDYQIQLTFNDGLSGVVNFLPFLDKGVFVSLQTIDEFTKFSLERGVITWKNGVDIAPEFLYSRVLEKSNSTNSFSYFEQY